MAAIWFARIYCSRLNTTNQSQGECKPGVNHSCTYAAGSPPPLRRAYAAVPLPHAGAVPALTWSDTTRLKLENNGREQTAQKNAHPTVGSTIAQITGKKIR